MTRSAPMLPGDELFSIALDDRSRQLRLADRVAGLGLAAALLSELVLWGRLDVDATHARVRPGQQPADALGALILEETEAEGPPFEVRPFLEFLATDAIDRVSHRLERRRLIRRKETRNVLGRSRTEYVPLDNNAVVWRAVRLVGCFTANRPGEQLHPADVVTGGLVAATSLSRVVLWLPEHRDIGGKIVGHVNDLPDPLRHLVRHAEAAIGDAALTPH